MWSVAVRFLALLPLCLVMSGCQSFIKAVTDDMYPIPEDQQRRTVECRDVSPAQLDNTVIRCREL